MERKCGWEDTILGNYLLTVGARSLLRRMKANVSELGTVASKVSNVTYFMEPNEPKNIPFRAEEVGIILLILSLWMAAITLFVHRWGKIRMLEPYQEPYKEIPRTSLSACHRLSAANFGSRYDGFPSGARYQRTRAQSVLVTMNDLFTTNKSYKRTRSAEDLSTHHEMHHKDPFFTLRKVPEVIEEDEEVDVKVV